MKSPAGAIRRGFFLGEGCEPSCYAAAMKTAFVLFLIALMILPAIVTVRIMLYREKKRQRDEQASPNEPEDRP